MSVLIPANPFPNVPNLPGVPQIKRSAQFPPSPAPGLGSPAAMGTLWASTQSAPVWGIFNGATAVVTPDSIINFGYKHSTNLPDYPIQQGAFGSFNRVSLPFETSVTMTKGGSLADRNAFLAQVDAIDTGPGALLLYTIVTAEKSYLNCNVMDVELTRRGAANAAWFDVEVRFRQIFPVSVQFSTSTNATSLAFAQDPSATPFVNQGLVQPQPLDFGTQNAVNQLFSSSPVNGTQ
jgi:hypothetical protein